MPPFNRFPDPIICRTRIQSYELWECMVENAITCPYNINIGAEYYCFHRDKSDYDTDQKKAKR
jgi:hypothetical protein